MIILSMQLFPDKFYEEKTEVSISAFEILELSKEIRSHIRQIHEYAQKLEDNNHKLRMNQFSVDCDLSFDFLNEAQKYVDSIGIDSGNSNIDFIEGIE